MKHRASTLSIREPWYPWTMTPEEIRASLGMIHSTLFGLAQEKEWSYAKIGKALGVSRAQAHHVFSSGKSGTSIDRLAGLARALRYRIILELMPEAQAEQFMRLRAATADLNPESSGLVERFARIVSSASDEQRAVWKAEFYVREQAMDRSSSGMGGTSNPNVSSTSSTSA